MGHKYKDHFCYECIWFHCYIGKIIRTSYSCVKDIGEDKLLSYCQEACRSFVPKKDRI